MRTAKIMKDETLSFIAVLLLAGMVVLCGILITACVQTETEVINSDGSRTITRTNRVDHEALSRGIEMGERYVQYLEAGNGEMTAEERQAKIDAERARVEGLVQLLEAATPFAGAVAEGKEKINGNT